MFQFTIPIIVLAFGLVQVVGCKHSGSNSEPLDTMAAHTGNGVADEKDLASVEDIHLHDVKNISFKQLLDLEDGFQQYKSVTIVRNHGNTTFNISRANVFGPLAEEQGIKTLISEASCAKERADIVCKSIADLTEEENRVVKIFSHSDDASRFKVWFQDKFYSRGQERTVTISEIIVQ
jgi:hypothetical protein